MCGGKREKPRTAPHIRNSRTRGQREKLFYALNPGFPLRGFDFINGSETVAFGAGIPVPRNIFLNRHGVFD